MFEIRHLVNCTEAMLPETGSTMLQTPQGYWRVRPGATRSCLIFRPDCVQLALQRGGARTTGGSWNLSDCLQHRKPGQNALTARYLLSAHHHRHGLCRHAVKNTAISPLPAGTCRW